MKKITRPIIPLDTWYQSFCYTDTIYKLDLCAVPAANYRGKWFFYVETTYDDGSKYELFHSEPIYSMAWEALAAAKTWREDYLKDK